MNRQPTFLVSPKRSVVAVLVCAFCLGGAPATALAGGKTQAKASSTTSTSSSTTTTDPFKATGRKNG